jgi:hypothetical protein
MGFQDEAKGKWQSGMLQNAGGGKRFFIDWKDQLWKNFCTSYKVYFNSNVAWDRCYDEVWNSLNGCENIVSPQLYKVQS